MLNMNRYDRLSLQACLDANSQFQQCRHEGCSSGQLCDPEKDNYIICVACNRRTCVKCDMPWHSGLSCEKTNTTREARDAEVEASEAFLREECKLCPKCKSPGKKETGCDHIVCKFAPISLNPIPSERS